MKSKHSNIVSSKSDLSNQGRLRKYDHIIIIPVYNEAIEDVLRVVHSVAMQNYKNGYTSERAVVININNTATESKNSESSIVYKQNLLVYNFLLKVVNLDKYFDFKSDSYFNSDKLPKKLIKNIISDIQKKISDKLLYVEIIDSFSSGNTQEESTIGLVRETGFRFAANYLASGEESLLFSTDADCMFGLDTMNTVEDMLSDNEVDFTTLNLDYHFENLDNRFVRAATRYRLSRNISTNLYSLTSELKKRYNLAGAITSVLLEKAFDLGGAFTVMRTGAYLKSSGYPSVSSKEDLYIAASIAKAGGKLKDLRKKYPLAIVYTSPRISHRVPEGYGRKIEKFAAKESDFLDNSVASVEAHLSISFLLRKIEIIIESGKRIDITIIRSLSNEICPWLGGAKGDDFLNDLLEIFSHKSIALYSKEHWDLSNKTKKLLRSDCVPQQTILEQINMLEKIYCESPQIFFTDSDFKLIEMYRNIWSYPSLRDFLLKRLQLIKDLDIDLIMPILLSQIVVIYRDLFMKDFKTNIIPAIKKRHNTISFHLKNLINFFKKDKQSFITIEKFLEYENNDCYQNLLIECEVKLFAAIRQGYKGVIPERVDNLISKHINKIGKGPNSL